MRGPIPEGLSERLFGVLAVVLAIALVAWLNMPKLLRPVFILMLILLSVDRWRRGVYPWPPNRRAN